MKFIFGISQSSLWFPLGACPQPSLAGNCGNSGGGGVGNPNCLSAPAPLIGAGLPGLAIGMGYGAYWLARRRRNQG